MQSHPTLALGAGPSHRRSGRARRSSAVSRRIHRSARRPRLQLAAALPGGDPLWPRRWQRERRLRRKWSQPRGERARSRLRTAASFAAGVLAIVIGDPVRHALLDRPRARADDEERRRPARPRAADPHALRVWNRMCAIPRAGSPADYRPMFHLAQTVASTVWRPRMSSWGTPVLFGYRGEPARSRIRGSVRPHDRRMILRYDVSGMSLVLLTSRGSASPAPRRCPRSSIRQRPQCTRRLGCAVRARGARSRSRSSRCRRNGCHRARTMRARSGSDPRRGRADIALRVSAASFHGTPVSFRRARSMVAAAPAGRASARRLHGASATPRSATALIFLLVAGFWLRAAT